MQNTIGQPQYQKNVVQQTTQQPVTTQPSVQCNSQPQTVQVPNYSGVNIQIFNPSVGVPGGAPVYNVNAPSYNTQPNCYPSNYYTTQLGPNNSAGTPQNGQTGVNTNGNSETVKNTENSGNISNNTTNTTNSTTTEEKKKTEKRNIVQLTDDYIKNLENYLNSQDKEIRLMGAKEVVARLAEDDSRKEDKALTALINKMLQDPSQPVRFMALAALDLRQVTGDDLTVKLLQAIQQSDSGYGQDALQASQILLKMSGQVVQKEFEAKPKEDKK